MLGDEAIYLGRAITHTFQYNACSLRTLRVMIMIAKEKGMGKKQTSLYCNIAIADSSMAQRAVQKK